MAKYNEQNKTKSIIVDNPPKSNYIKLNTLKKTTKKKKIKNRMNFGDSTLVGELNKKRKKYKNKR